MGFGKRKNNPKHKGEKQGGEIVELQHVVIKEEKPASLEADAIHFSVSIDNNFNAIIEMVRSLSEIDFKRFKGLFAGVFEEFHEIKNRINLSILQNGKLLRIKKPPVNREECMIALRQEKDDLKALINEVQVRKPAIFVKMIIDIFEKILKIKESMQIIVNNHQALKLEQFSFRQ